MATATTVTKLEKIVVDVQECISELKSEFQDSKIPIDDDCTTLHRFYAKLEYILQFGQKNKTNILGSRKDYWDYFQRALANDGGRGVHDGVRFVKCISELKTSLGKGRAFIRFCLMHQCLADTLQCCLINEKITSAWYDTNSVLRKSEQWSPLVSSLYELSDVQFDLSPRGHDLDVSWPTFARKIFGTQYSWHPPSRSLSVSSLSSLVSQVDSVVMSQGEGDSEEHKKLQQEIAELEASREELLNNLDEMNSKEEESRKIALKAVTELEELKATIEEKSQMLEAENNSLKEELCQMIETWKKRELEWVEQIKQAEKCIGEQKTGIEELEAENSRIKNSEEAKIILQQRIDELECEKSRLQQCLEQLESELKTLRCSEVVYNNRIDALQSEVTNLSTANNELKSAIQGLHSTKEQQAAENVMICQRLGELSSQLQASQLTLQELHKEKCSLQSKLETSEVENKNANSTISLMKKEFNGLKEQVNQLENENRHMQWEALEREKEKVNFDKEMAKLKSHLQSSVNLLSVKDGEVSQAKASLSELKQNLESILQDRNNDQVNVLDKLNDLETFVFKLGDDVKDLSSNVICDLSSSIARLASKPQSRSSSNDAAKNANENGDTSSQSVQLVESLFQKQETVIDNLLEKIEGFLKGSYHFNAHMNVLQKLLNVELSEELATADANSLESQVLALESIHKLKFDNKHQKSSGVVNTVGRILNKLCDLLKKNTRLQVELDSSHRMSSYIVNYIQEHRKQISEATIDVAATENIVALLHKEHTKLKTAEAILKYELQQKRKLLTNLREQLFSTRKQWGRVQKMNSSALMEWKDLRTEFSLRNKQASEESGFVDDKKDTDSDIADEGIASPTNDEPALPNTDPTNLDSPTSSAIQTESLSTEDLDSELIESGGATAAEPTRSRLDILEEQCRLLYVSLLRSSQRSAYLEQRLQALFSSDEETSVELDAPSTSEEISEQDNADPVSDYSQISEDPVMTGASEPSSPESETNVWNSATLLSRQQSSNASASTMLQDMCSSLQSGSDTTSEDSCTQSMQDDTDSNKNLLCLCDPSDEDGNAVGELRKRALDKLVAKLKEERSIHECEMATMKEEIERLQTTNSQLEERISSVEDEKDRIALRESEFRKRVDFIFKKERGSFDARITELIDSKSALETQVSEVKDELLARNELVTSLETSLQRAQDELSETKSEMTGEILLLKQQQSTEALKYEQSLKHYIEQETSIAKLKEQIEDQANLIMSLENALGELRENRNEEKQKHWHELEELKMKLSARDEECSILNEELKKALKEVDDEKRKLEALESEYKKTQMQLKDYIAVLEAKLTQVQADNVELKKHFVKLIKDKDMLWKRTVQLCQFKNVKEAEKWMDDKDVNNCLGCKTPFSLMLRRHHCRLCGGIFCHACSNNWLNLSTSRRPARACNSCYNQHLNIESAISDAGSITNISDDNDPVNKSEISLSNSEPSFLYDSCTTINYDEHDSSSVASFYLHAEPDQTSLNNDDQMLMKIDIPDGNAERSTPVLTKNESSDPTPDLEKETDGAKTTNTDKYDFYIITDEEITRSLSACSPYNSITGQNSKDVDGVHMIFTRTVEDIEEGGTDGVSGEIWVNAGQQVGIPIIIEEVNLKLIWEFTSEPKSTSFSLIYRETGSVEDASDIQILLGTTRVRSHEYTICGHLVAKKPGLYILIFDNQHSRFMTKKICYCLKTQRNLTKMVKLNHEDN